MGSLGILSLLVTIIKVLVVIQIRLYVHTSGTGQAIVLKVIYTCVLSKCNNRPCLMDIDYIQALKLHSFPLLRFGLAVSIFCMV
jgi:hypothetical protein